MPVTTSAGVCADVRNRLQATTGISNRLTTVNPGSTKNHAPVAGGTNKKSHVTMTNNPEKEAECSESFWRRVKSAAMSEAMKRHVATNVTSWDDAPACVETRGIAESEKATPPIMGVIRLLRFLISND